MTLPPDVTFGPDGNVYVASSNTNEILRYDATTGKFVDVFVMNDPSDSMLLDGPRGLAFSSDNNYLYVSSSFTDEILRYDAATGDFLGNFITDDIGGLDSPAGVAFGPDGNVYVASSNTNEILRYDAATGDFLGNFITDDIGSIKAPTGVAFGPDGNVYVASSNTNEILRYDAATGDFVDKFITDDIGSIKAPTGVAFGPDGNVYVASSNTNEILRYDAATGDFLDKFITDDIGGLDSSTGVAFGPDGNVYVASSNTNEILRYDAITGKLVQGEKFIADKSNGLNRPANLEIKNAKLCVSSNFNKSINCYDEETGKNLTRYVTSTQNSIAHNDNSVLGPDGELYMSNNLTDEIVTFDGTDSKLVLKTTDSILHSPSYLTFKDNHMYVSSDDKVFKFDRKGDFVDTFVVTNAGSLRNPQGLSFTNDSLIVNSYNDRILQYGLDGKFEKEFTSSKDENIVKPVGMVIDNQGNLFTTTQTGKILQYSQNGDLLEIIDIPINLLSECVPPEKFKRTSTPDPHGLLFNDGKLYLTVFNKNAFMIYDLNTDKFTEIRCNEHLSGPESLALHGNILYISNSLPNRQSENGSVIEYDLSNDAFSPLSVKYGEGRFSLPKGLFFNELDNALYIANSDNNEILRYDTIEKSLEVFSHVFGGSITPGGITFGPDENLYMINEKNNDIYRYDLEDNKFINVFVEFNTSLDAYVDNLELMQISSYQEDMREHFVNTVKNLKCDNHDILTSANSPILNCHPGDMKLKNIIFTHDGRFLFASVPSIDGIFVYDQQGFLHDIFIDSDNLKYPTDIALDPDGRHLLVTNYGSNTISRLMISDGYLSLKDSTFVAPGTDDDLIRITQIGFDSIGNLYVVGGKYNHILQYSSNGDYLGTFDVDAIYLNKFSENLLRHYTLNGIDTKSNDVLVVYDNFLEQPVAKSTLDDTVEFLTPIVKLSNTFLSLFKIIEDPDLQSKEIVKHTGFFTSDTTAAYGQVLTKNVDQQLLVKIETFSIDYDKSNYASLSPYHNSGIPQLLVCISSNYNECTAPTTDDLQINELKVNAGDNLYLLHDEDFVDFDPQKFKLFIHDGEKVFADIEFREYGLARISLNSFSDWLFHYLPVFPFIGMIMLFPIVFDYVRSLFKLLFFPIYWLTSPKSKRPPNLSEKITILIPAHNEEYGIKEAIESALATDYSNKEIIVIDDGSKDNTYLIAHKFAEKGLIKLIHRETASGSKATALNYGANYATGEYIICMDGDTKLDKDALKNAIVNFDDDDVVALSGNVKIISGDDGITNTVTKLQSYEYMVAIELGRRFTSFFQILLVISGAFGFFKKNFFRGVRTFDKDTLTEDFDLTLKLRKTKHKIRFVGDSIAYTYCPNNMSVWRRQRNRWAYGQFQTLLKNKNILTKSKFSIRDKISFLDMFVLDIFLALLFPIGLIVLGVVSVSLYLEENLQVLVYPLFFTMMAFLVIELLIFLYAIAHSKSNKTSSLKLVYLVPVMTFFYRPYLKMINLRAYIRAFLKKQSSW